MKSERVRAIWKGNPLDRVLGLGIMGLTGATIGFYIGGAGWIALGLFLGCVLGFAVSKLEARRFFISVLVGFLFGAAVSLFLDRVEETMVILAGTGAAAGGFIGINIELLKRKSKKPYI